MLKNIYQQKICIQKILPHQKREFKKLRKNQRLSAAFWNKKLWKRNAVIRIGFLSSGENIRKNTFLEKKDKPIDPLQKEVKETPIQEMVKKIVRERIIPLVNLDIDFTDNINNANVRIDFDPQGGSWSLVGTDHLNQKSGATMNFGWFDVPTTIHEFCHMLGMIHEHQNPRNSKIQWDKEKVFEWAKNTQGWDEKTTKHNIIDKYKKSNINGSEYDPLSIMLYFFPAELTTNNKGTQQNLRFSALDVLWINKMYANGDTQEPSEFYKKVYDESIEKSIEKTEKNNTKNNDSNTSSVIIPILLVFFIILIIFMI